MCKVKKWLVTKYLPAYAKEAQAANEAHYTKKLDELQRENDKLRAYIAGLEQGIKAVRKVQIYNRGEQ